MTQTAASQQAGNSTGGPTGVPPKTFEIVTTAQVERTYTVQANNEEQARTRLRTHLADPDMLREGVVIQGKQVDATPQRIKGAKS